MQKYNRELLIKAMFDEDIKLLPIKTKNGNIIYINSDRMLLSELFSISVAIAKELEVQIILNYKEFNYLIDKETTKVDITDQTTKQNTYDAYYSEILQIQKIEKILETATIENIANKLNEIEKIKEKILLYPGLRAYKRVTPSQKLYELYKLSQPDIYLDNMVEEAKLLIKK